MEVKRALREGTFLCMSPDMHRLNLRDKIALFRAVYHVMSHSRSFFMRMAVYSFVGQDSIVNMARCYRLGGSGIKSQWGRDYLHPSRPAVGPVCLIKWVPGHFPVGKVARAWY